jgi:hypothetical protein
MAVPERPRGDDGPRCCCGGRTAVGVVAGLAAAASAYDVFECVLDVGEVLELNEPRLGGGRGSDMIQAGQCRG